MLSLSHDRRAQMFMSSAHTGALAMIAYVAGRVMHWPDFAMGMTIGISLVSMLALLWFSRTDEYLLRLWHAGVTSGFVLVVVAFLYAPVMAGWSDALAGHPTPPQGAAAQFAGMLAILAFYIGLHVQWLRSRA